MSDEKKREELKAQINEKLDELSIEELELISGGTSGESENETLQLLWDLLDPDKKNALAAALKKTLDEKQNG